jgi:hypothetical protein
MRAVVGLFDANHFSTDALGFADVFGRLARCNASGVGEGWAQQRQQQKSFPRHFWTSGETGGSF